LAPKRLKHHALVNLEFYAGKVKQKSHTGKNDGAATRRTTFYISMTFASTI
jgi:hypothetical protein